MLYFSEVTNKVRAFLHEQKGAVTVEFIALTASLVLLALAVGTAVQEEAVAGVGLYDLTTSS
jgi:hypothetical protein